MKMLLAHKQDITTLWQMCAMNKAKQTELVLTVTFALPLVSG